MSTDRMKVRMSRLPRLLISDGTLVPTNAQNSGGSQGTDLLVPNPTYLGNLMFADEQPVPGAKAGVLFTLTGLRHQTVRISDITAEVTGRKPSPKGTIIFYPPQGYIPNLKLGFDLDSQDTSARTLGVNSEVQPTHYFKENTVTLGNGESMGFVSVVYTLGCACEFNLHVQFSDGSSLNIDKNGKPFHLAAYRDDYARYYSPQLKNDAPRGQTQWVLTQCESLAACSKISYHQR